MRINMNKKDKEAYDKLSEDEQQVILQNHHAHMQGLLLKTALLSQLTIETFDELENYDMYRHELKRDGKKFSRTLDKYMTDVFKVDEDSSLSANYVHKVSEAFDKILKEI